MNRSIALFSPLLWPDSQAVTALDRQSAHAHVERAVTGGLLTEREARDRQDLLATARTRGRLRGALRDIPGAAPPPELTAALRIAATAWLALCAIQLTVWAVIAVFTGHLDAPWWLWSDVVGGLIVGGLWWANERYHRQPRVDLDSAL
jgi:hypothetical protein